MSPGLHTAVFTVFWLVIYTPHDVSKETGGEIVNMIRIFVICEMLPKKKIYQFNNKMCTYMCVCVCVWTGRTRTENTERKKLCETVKLFWKADRIIWDGGQGEGTQLKKMKRHNVCTLGSEGMINTGNQCQSLSFHLLP